MADSATLDQVDINARLAELTGSFDVNHFRTLHEEISFAEYLQRVYTNPKIVRSAYQRLYDMIMEHGYEEFKLHRKTYKKYHFFNSDASEVRIHGLDDTLNKLVQFFRGAAGGYGAEKRLLLLHGPVGSAKSTICRRIKKGLEAYSETDAGQWYTYKWVNLPTPKEATEESPGEEGVYLSDTNMCPMHDEPLKLLPEALRNDVLKDLNVIHLDQTDEENRSRQYSLRVNGELNPRSKKFMNELLKKYDGDYSKVIENHIRVVRMAFSESDRMGVATFQPKDEKNQDATELTGDIDYSKLPYYGSDSDPRAFNFDGEFCVGHRGVTEFIEVLKLAKEFLYDLLGAAQERQIKPKKFPQIDLDTVLMSHTNNPEYEKLRADPTMEALRDRTVRIDVPYLLDWDDETKVLEQDYGGDRIPQHVAPHTLEIAALWGILTRLQNDKDGNLSLVNKARLYNGESLPGYTDDKVREMREKYPNEGLGGGVSVRYIQNKISNTLASHHDYINPFMVMNELKAGLSNSSLIANGEEVGNYEKCVDLAIKELGEILKNEVQNALVSDENAIKRLCSNYIDNVMASINGSKVMNSITEQEQEPDERLMRSIEEKIDIPEQMTTDFRQQLAAFIGDLAHKNKSFEWDSNPELKRALEKKLFEETKDHIKLSALNVSGASVVDDELQDKIDAVKARLIRQYGYNERSATDVLDYVGSIFARGDIVDD